MAIDEKQHQNELNDTPVDPGSPVGTFDREKDVDSAFRQTRPGSAQLHGERDRPGHTPAERSWDDGGHTTDSTIDHDRPDMADH